MSPTSRNLRTQTMIFSNTSRMMITSPERRRIFQRFDRATLVKLYAAILTYLDRNAQFFNRNPFKRALRSVFTTSTNERLLQDILERRQGVERCVLLVQGDRQNDLSETIAKLEALHCDQNLSVIEGAVAQLRKSSDGHHQQLLQILADHSIPVHRIAVQVSELVDDMHTDRRARMLNWLSVTPVEQHHQQLCRNRLSGTGIWLFAKKEWRAWIESSFSSILWLHGIPGSGKTMLT